MRRRAASPRAPQRWFDLPLSADRIPQVGLDPDDCRNLAIWQPISELLIHLAFDPWTNSATGEDQEILVAVTSWGDPKLVAMSFSHRVDTEHSLPFIQSVIDSVEVVTPRTPPRLVANRADDSPAIGRRPGQARQRRLLRCRPRQRPARGARLKQGAQAPRCCRAVAGQPSVTKGPGLGGSDGRQFRLLHRSCWNPPGLGLPAGSAVRAIGPSDPLLGLDSVAVRPGFYPRSVGGAYCVLALL